MDEKTISRLCLEKLHEVPNSVERCAVGIGNYVYIEECGGVKYVVRCSEAENAYKDTVYWLKGLRPLGIPVPEVIAHGRFGGYEYVILSYFEGTDIGEVYRELSGMDKREIAREIVRIQSRVSEMEVDVPPDWSWLGFVEEMLDRAEKRIIKNGYFEPERVQRLRAAAAELREYFAAVKPVAYLDDVSSKNLIIHKGRISGIVDVDWMGMGDRLTYVALTNMALLNMDCDTDYVNYILAEMQPSAVEKRVFLFYTLLYCVDFMGERGMEFLGKTIAVSPEIIERLNEIYDGLWREWRNGMFREMARPKQKLSESECIEILKNEPRGVLAVLGDGNYPYALPIDHWYCEDDGKIYFHSGKTGHKIDAIRAHDKVSFCVYDEGYRKEGDWALNIRSVIVFGRVEIVEDHERAVELTRRLSYKYTSDSEYIEREIRSYAHELLCFALVPEHISGKIVKES